MQRLLLDTHVLVWWLSDTEKLAPRTRAAIANPRNQVFVSAITGWEIAVKRAKRRIVAPERMETLIEERGFIHLPLAYRHAERAAQLPMHHRDPFDRFLIAQAQTDGLIVVTRDERIPLYDVRTLAA